MATVRKDLITEARFAEVGGVAQSLTRKFLVEGLGTTNSGIMAEALGQHDIPAANSQHPIYTNLYCIRRSTEVDKDSPDKVWVFCDYEPVSRAVFNQEENQFRVTGGTGLVQKRTAYDAYGDQIVVEHTFPADDPDYPSETVTQGGEVDVLSPQSTLVFEGIIRTAYPHYISSEWNGFLNSAYWAGGDIGTWLCSDVRFSLFQPPQNSGVTNTLDLFLPLWNFTFEFLWDYEGHVQYAKYVDERKNRPAPDLVAGVGIVPVYWHPYRDFNELYPV